MGVAQYNEQLAAAEQAAAHARALDDEYILTTAQERRAAALLLLGRLEEARRALTEEVIPASEAAGNLWTSIIALHDLVEAYVYLGDYHRARAYLQRAIVLAERLGDSAALAYLLYERGLNAFVLGQWQQARPDFEQAVTFVGTIGQIWYATPAHGLGLLCLAEGRQEEAAHHLKEALRLAQQNHDLVALCWVQAALAEWELLAGRAEAARARLAPLLEAPGPMVSYSKEALALLAWTHLEVGEVGQAQALLSQVLNTARQERMKPALVHVLRVQALLLSRQERWQEAEQDLQEALTLCHKMATPYFEAKTLYAAALVSRKKKEFGPARQRLEEAFGICTRLGERLYAQHIEQLLAQANTGEQDFTPESGRACE